MASSDSASGVKSARSVNRKLRSRRSPPSSRMCGMIRQMARQIGRKVASEIGAGALGLRPLPSRLAQRFEIGKGAGEGQRQIVEVDRLGDEVEGAAVHRRADVLHVAVGGDDDGPQQRRALLQSGEQRQTVHARHVDVRQDDVDAGIGIDQRQRLLAVASEQEMSTRRRGSVGETSAAPAVPGRARRRRRGSAPAIRRSSLRVHGSRTMNSA